MTTPLSKDFIISYTVNAAILAAVSASISTPVCPVVLTVEVISMPGSVSLKEKSTFTFVI